LQRAVRPRDSPAPERRAEHEADATTLWIDLKIFFHKAAPTTLSGRCSTRAGAAMRTGARAQIDATAGGAGSDRTRNTQERHDEPEGFATNKAGPPSATRPQEPTSTIGAREATANTQEIHGEPAMVRGHNGPADVDGPNACAQLRPARSVAPILPLTRRGRPSVAAHG